jgi:hypothetical protein
MPVAGALMQDRRENKVMFMGKFECDGATVSVMWE